MQNFLNTRPSIFVNSFLDFFALSEVNECFDFCKRGYDACTEFVEFLFCDALTSRSQPSLN